MLLTALGTSGTGEPRSIVLPTSLVVRGTT
jgi:hypothetical protein